MSFLKDIIPTILGVLDKFVPAKGYRNIIFGVLFAVALGLQSYGVLPEDVAKVLVPGLLALTTYMAGAHEKE